MIHKTAIIPESQIFHEIKAPHAPDLKAICTFTALGFFLDDDTFLQHRKVLKPGHDYELDNQGKVLSAKPWFKWTYQPREIQLKQATAEFAEIFHHLIQPYKDQNLKIILPISGGLDSRSQATSLKNYKNVMAYSYSFNDGIDENLYGRQVAAVLNFPFREYRITKGYLWDKVDRMAEINQCYSDFTHPRQMAIEADMPHLGDIFYLGHWGDVLFDNFGLKSKMTEAEMVDLLMNKIVKKGGMIIASDLWKLWQLPGQFEPYLRERILSLLKGIEIDDANAKIRAFKSMYWAPRWTSVSLSFFKAFRPVFVPYFSEEMCRFITTVPENLLQNRRIQIDYIKKFSPELAAIEWQDVRPLSINNAHLYRTLPYFLRRQFNIIKNKTIGRKIITRNWELQFSGKENLAHLEEHLMHPKHDLIPKEFYQKYLYNFSNIHPEKFAHPLSMLLNISNASLND